MAELPQLPEEPVWFVVVAALELLTRKQSAEGRVSDTDIQKDSDLPLSLLRDLDTADIKYDLQNNPTFRNQVLDLHKMARASGIYDGVANIALGFVVVLLFVGLVLGTQGGVIGAVDAIVPALGPFIYASVLPVLIGIVASWKSQGILSEEIYPKIIEMLATPGNELLKAAVAERRAFLEGREAAKSHDMVEETINDAKNAFEEEAELITPARDAHKAHHANIDPVKLAPEKPIGRHSRNDRQRPPQRPS